MATSEAELPLCRCGHDRHHNMVSAEGVYSPWAWVGLIVGISVRPHTVTFRCRRCDQLFDRTHDPAVLAKHV